VSEGIRFKSAIEKFPEVDQRHVQKQPGHAGTEMIRRDRFRVKLTKASGDCRDFVPPAFVRF